MERPGAGPSLHRLIGEAVDRGARLQEESREAVSEARASLAALEVTVAETRNARARRKFGNGQFDVREGQRPG